MKKICITCGKEFETNKNAQKSCSEVCRKIRRKYTDKRKIGKYKVDKICPVCNKNFKGNKTQIACSIKCASEQRKTKLIKKCLRCGKEFKEEYKGKKQRIVHHFKSFSVHKHKHQRYDYQSHAIVDCAENDCYRQNKKRNIH